MKKNKKKEITELFQKYNSFLTQTQKQSLHLYLIENLSITKISKIVVVSRQAINDAIKKGIAKLENIQDKLKK